ncbi:MAG: hypothetical protein K940chlam3_00998 [Chlamydiae bacterium]|nr:hypothetical protein [Chlamydiota bacterium]
MIPSDLQFQHPALIILALVIVGIIFLFWYLQRYRKKIIQEFGSEQIMDRILHPRADLFFQWKVILLCLAWLFAIFALMGPEGDAHYPDALQSQTTSMIAHEIVVVVDVSDSMSVADTRVGQSRLNHSKEIADTLASQLAGKDLSLFTFTSEASQQVPETMDALFLRLMLNQLKINEGGISGTDYLKSFKEIDKYLKTRPKEKLLSVVLFSDGGDTKWESLSGEEKKAREAEIAKTFEEIDAMIVTVGMGSEKPQKISGIKYKGQPVTTKLEPELLKKIGQQYFEANNETTIGLTDKILQELDREAPGRGKVKVQTAGIEYDRYFQLPLFFAMLFLLLALWIPETKVRKTT